MGPLECAYDDRWTSQHGDLCAQWLDDLAAVTAQTRASAEFLFKYLQVFSEAYPAEHPFRCITVTAAATRDIVGMAFYQKTDLHSLLLPSRVPLADRVAVAWFSLPFLRGMAAFSVPGTSAATHMRFLRHVYRFACENEPDVWLAAGAEDMGQRWPERHADDAPLSTAACMAAEAERAGMIFAALDDTATMDARLARPAAPVAAKQEARALEGEEASVSKRALKHAAKRAKFAAKQEKVGMAKAQHTPPAAAVAVQVAEEPPQRFVSVSAYLSALPKSERRAGTARLAAFEKLGGARVRRITDLAEAVALAPRLEYLSAVQSARLGRGHLVHTRAYFEAAVRTFGLADAHLLVLELLPGSSSTNSPAMDTVDAAGGDPSLEHNDIVGFVHCLPSAPHTSLLRGIGFNPAQSKQFQPWFILLLHAVDAAVRADRPVVDLGMTQCDAKRKLLHHVHTSLIAVVGIVSPRCARLTRWILAAAVRSLVGSVGSRLTKKKPAAAASTTPDEPTTAPGLQTAPVHSR